MTIKNDLLLKALKREKTNRTPSWMMRQAGRYLPEYLETRKKAGSFMSLCKNPDLACEVTLQPITRYNFDAAILFSDILTIPDALGLGLHFTQGEGPAFEKIIETERDVEQLGILDIHDSLNYVISTVEKITHELNGSIPLIGFAGSPWTLATYMVEGKPSKTFSKIKKMMYTEPALLHKLLQNLTINTTNYLNAQIEAGVNAIQIFDTWGGVLGHSEYIEFSLKYMKNIIDGLNLFQNNEKIPVIIYTKGGGMWLNEIADSGCDCVGVDWTVNLAHARKLIGDKVSIQGNMDPTVLYSSKDNIEKYVQKIITEYGDGFDKSNPEYNLGHVFNLGHGILPDINPDSPKIMLEVLHNLTSR